MAADLVAGVDVGGTNVRMGVATGSMALERHARLRTSSIASPGRTPELLLDAIESFIAPDRNRVRALCMGFPSIVSRDGRTIVQTPNVVGLDRVPMADLARERFGFPVFVQKDVNLLLRHDIGALGLEDADPVLGFYVGTGFGNSIRIGGTFFAGANGAAGELGHIPLTGNAEVCSCGNKGCAETIAAGKSLAARMASRHPGLSIGDCFVECGDDPWIDEFVDLVSFPIAIEMNILDPEAVILGGGVVNMRGFPLERLVDAVRAKLRAPYPRESVRILHAEESTLSGVIGAIGYALDAL